MIFSINLIIATTVGTFFSYGVFVTLKVSNLIIGYFSNYLFPKIELYIGDYESNYESKNYIS